MRCKIIFIIIILVSICLNAFSQIKEEDYRKQASVVRDYVWGLKLPSFQKKNISEDYSKYSKVIVAKYAEYTALSKSKVVFGFGIYPKKNLTYTTTLRQLVKINDVATLNEYSTISFQKFAQIDKDKLTTFLGVRVIKANGEVEEVDPDEIILTDNNAKNKKAKLAISDLQVGDMIDYFIQTVQFFDNEYELGVENLMFADDAPTINYTVHIELAKKLTLRYRLLNNAPPFKISHVDDNTIMDLEQENIAPYPVNLWMSVFRQVPIIRFQILLGSNQNDDNSYTRSRAEGTINSAIYTIQLQRMQINHVLLGYRDQALKYAKSYLDNNGGGDPKNNSLSIFYGLRHSLLMTPDYKSISAVDAKRNYSNPNNIFFLSVLELVLNKIGMNSKFVLYSSRFGPNLDDIFQEADLQLGLVTEDNHLYTCVSNYPYADMLPYYLEGQPGVSFDFKRIAGIPKMSTDTGTISDATTNVQVENLFVNINTADIFNLNIDRKIIFSGQQKISAQKQLYLYEDIYEDERKELGISKTFTDELKDDSKGKKILDEYIGAFADARKEWNENCKQEIKDNFDIVPETIENNIIEQSGLFEKKPEFIYRVKFNVNAWIKKAGNNLILESGKLIGTQISLDQNEINRKEDIYMPYARTFKYNIQILVPKGYTPEGLDKLNMQLKNDQGSFSSTCKYVGDTINISVTKIYEKSFVAVADWQDILKIIGAANLFTDTKILFRKL